ncbi:uncharacterized protein LOC130750031 isoform X1 [Actinidia eriantha]|uniref:uncharacterized protein LOC130750031 isoform X1 n=1 Tax=Actinidia eriantha TaxID=165200 RepID=UPI0025887D3F|nr:uncharacterized protein LOC130750031 isoform X1 [Actinidia eriantha]XP_057459410.1 uncharacterized protein LOC130750031 isoform X1 [Actinidia eriantha]
MAESERDREIQVRSLTGESATVSISPDQTIRDLKLLLTQTFPPAANSPQFHLFLKGVKLDLQSKISTHSIEPEEFMVLVPYTKKDQQQTKQDNKTVTHLKDKNEFSDSKAADSAWSDMMHDLSFLRNITRENQRNVDSKSANSADTNEVAGVSPINWCSETKLKNRFRCDAQEGHIDDVIISILHSYEMAQLDQRNCKRLMQVLELVNCLSNLHSGNCMFKEAYLHGSNVNPYGNKNNLCLCPSWLKTVMKAFYFLNIYSAYLQMRCERITSACLKEALDRLDKFGLQVGIADVEHLSVLCPQVVRVVNDEMAVENLFDALVIINSSVKQRHKVKTQTRVTPSQIVNAIKKREVSFKTILCNAVKLLMHKNGNETEKFLSLEDLLMFVKEGGNNASRNEAKRPRRSKSAVSSSHSIEDRCHETNPLLPVEMVEHLKRGIGTCGQMVHVEEISARVANLVEIPIELSDNMKSSLNCIGITRLYSHQAESVRASLSGKNVVVATMTSSGKSLCYNLPVLEVLSQNLLACALYLFPTKALAQDQLRALLSMAKGFDTSLNIGIYDGDTRQADRMWLRDNARLLITNPDMLHMSILPFHGQFSRILSNLRFVVIDEAHAYKGAFGCHTALILRRLRRLCSHVYGSDPSFVFCTATSANPREHAMELANLRTMELIQNDGSPSSRKLFVLWNPPLYPKAVLKKTANSIDTEESSNRNVIFRRSSPIMEVSCLFAEIVQHGLRCIAFCKTRKLCELVLCYTREILQETAPHLVNSVCAYRAGYIAEDRRRIESEFFSGNLCGVAATNALELGIDVGHIDVTLHLGFPGSIASLWQQAGRSGRREKASLAIYVAFEGPLDQYFMKFPQKLFRSRIECCHIDAQNQQVLERHLVCAAVEHPLSLLHDENYFGHGLKNAVMALKSKGFLSTDPSRDSSAEIWSYIGCEKMPSHAVSIRAIETEKYKVIDKQKNEVLEEIEESRAFFQVYDGAVYMHQGKTYLVKELDISTKIAWCQVADLKYFTKTRDYTDVHVIGGDIAYPARISNIQFSRTTAQAHTCKVTTTWFGFYRIWRGSNQIFDTVDLLLPKYSYESQAVWIRVPQYIKAAVEIEKLSFRAGLHAAGHALLNVVPLYIICNSSDLASECVNPRDTRYVPERILLYDQHPGGTGISAQVQPLFTELLTAALELLTSCRCSGDTGCPNCVQSLSCHEYNEVLHKDTAIMIIKGVLDAEKSYFGELS